MKVLKELTLDRRMYPGVQDAPSSHFKVPFFGDLDLYQYYIIEVNGTKYLADTTLFNQCCAGDHELIGTIPLTEDEVIVSDSEQE